MTKVSLNSLKASFENVDSDRKVLGIKLVEQAKFMQKTMKTLMDIINKQGAITKMSQGSYSIDRANPALNQYVAINKTFQSCLKQINDLLPKEDLVSEDNFDEDDL